MHKKALKKMQQAEEDDTLIILLSVFYSAVKALQQTKSRHKKRQPRLPFLLFNFFNV